MHNLALLVDEVRDIIIKLDKSPDVLENHPTRMQLCSCLDVIKDTERCLEAFLMTDIDGLNVGNKYMYAYGSLQALVLQQDAVKHFTCTLKKDYPRDQCLKEIREVRNRSVGHPTDQGRDSGKTFNFITRDSIGNLGFELGTTYADGSPNQSKCVNLPHLIEAQRNIFAPVLLDVINTIGGEDI